MNKLMKNKYRILALLILTLVLGAATYGLAAANTVDANVAGEGFGAVSGYDVTNVIYTIDSGDPTTFSNVRFTLDAGATTSNVFAGTSAAGGVGLSWSSCTLVAGTTFDCAISGDVDVAVELHVAAAQ
jgi:hypothetical protein